MDLAARALLIAQPRRGIMQIDADLINAICKTQQDALLAAHNGAAGDVSRITCALFIPLPFVLQQFPL
jgi:hypothetical protein